MNTDSYYEIGAGHVYCQDYSRAGKLFSFDETYYVSVSDGCSSSKDSDLGARFWAKYLPTLLHALTFEKNIEEEAITKILSDLGEDDYDESYDATMVGALYDKAKDILYYAIIGDGKILFHNKDYLLVESLSFKSNAPYYPTYHIDKARAKGYDEAFGTDYGDLNVNIYSSDDKNILLAQEFKKKLFVKKFENFSKTNYTAVSVTTDGLDTFYNKDTRVSIPLDKVLKEIFPFKNLQGQFVERRMLAFKRFCEKNNWAHFDDISLATMHF